MLNSPQNGRSTCTYNHPHNLHQKFVPPLQLTFTSLFHHPLLIHKTILSIPINTPSLCNSAIFKVPIFTYSHPYNLLQKLFPFLNHLVNSGWIKVPVTSDTVLISSCFTEVWAGIPALTITDLLSLSLRKLVYCKQFSLRKMLMIRMANHPIHLLIYAYAITRPHNPLELSCLIVTIFILKFELSYTIQTSLH